MPFLCTAHGICCGRHTLFDAWMPLVSCLSVVKLPAWRVYAADRQVRPLTGRFGLPYLCTACGTRCGRHVLSNVWIQLVTYLSVVKLPSWRINAADMQVSLAAGLPYLWEACGICCRRQVLSDAWMPLVTITLLRKSPIEGTLFDSLN